MDSSASKDLVCEFAGFRLDTQRQRLLDARGKPVAITSRALETLAYLIRHRDRIVGKSELLQAVWPNVVVEENNLSQVISALRRIFGEERGEQRFIVTVSGRGYRFVADVQMPASGLLETQHAIAVLPFANLTGEPAKQFVGDGMAEELILMLARVAGLRVSSRTASFAYRERATRVEDIARDLNVGLLIEGSVRSAGERIRVAVQIIDARSGFQSWSKTFERRFDDIFALQDEIAAEVVATVCGGEGSSQQSTLPRVHPTHDVEAYQLYLQGASIIGTGSEAGAHHARSLFARAVERDPSFARAICAEAATTLRLATEFSTGPLAQALEHCEARALHALTLDASLAEAEALLGSIYAHRLDWVRAENQARRASAIDPALLALTTSTLQPLNGYAFGMMMATGHIRRGRQAAQHNFNAAPAVPIVVLMLAIAHAFEGRDDEALRLATLAERMGWSNVPLPMILAQLAQRAGRFAEAGRIMQQSFPPAAHAAGMTKLVDLVYRGLNGAADRPAALEAIRALLTAQPARVASTPSLAMLLMQWATCLGDVDLAYRIGDHALAHFLAAGCVPIASFVPQLWLPEMRAFRLDPRFHEFAAERLKMLPFWIEHGPPDHCALRDGRVVCE